MRIISGTHKGRRINPPKNITARPTTDFAKEGLFNILNNDIDFEGLKVLDIFCGTGNITFEFASRGATDITSVDDNFQCCDFVKKTISDFKMPQVKVIKSDAFSFLKKTANTFQLIFVDPPYEMELEKFELIPELVFSKNLLQPDGFLIIEHGAKTDFTKHEHFGEHRKYGNVNFSFFKNNS
ncbi:MAG: 16S rRNA (guanine(966)-N(2))-methyltransferase RsmD [Bacteroidia bacterium]|nr:16S rRNA (guanine(966)-N(2))-methyltransferase RsmD [Bacteroidia bacterium]